MPLCLSVLSGRIQQRVTTVKVPMHKGKRVSTPVPAGTLQILTTRQSAAYILCMSTVTAVEKTREV